jgi:hypothetical protein
MPAIKVIRKTTPEDPEMVDLYLLREEWAAARSQLDPSPSLSGACTISGCRTMPFVALKTNTGRRALCLRHFERLRVETV